LQRTERLAAESNEARGGVKGKRAGEVGSGDLALAEAEDGVWDKAQGAPESGEGDADGKKSGLSDLDAV